jgi:Phage integrase family
MALRREDVDLAAGVVHVRRGWDQEVGEVAPKSAQGRRKVPIPAALRDRLLEYLMDGPAAGRIFIGLRESYVRGREAAGDAKVERPTLHDCRHGYASLMIAAGVNVKALSTFMGHANIRITLDQYGHLLPGAEDEAAGLLDASSRGRQAGQKSTRLQRRLQRTRPNHGRRVGSPRCTTSDSPPAIEQKPAPLRGLSPPVAPSDPLCGTPIGPHFGPHEPLNEGCAHTRPHNDRRPAMAPGARKDLRGRDQHQRYVVRARRLRYLLRPGRRRVHAVPRREGACLPSSKTAPVTPT